MKAPHNDAETMRARRGPDNSWRDAVGGTKMFLLDTPRPDADSLREKNSAADPLSTYFLARLSRLLSLRCKARDQVSASGVQLLDNAIYSTYRDLRSLGREREAHALLEVYRELRAERDAA